MTDRSLLEAAAKAAGIKLRWGGVDGDVARIDDEMQLWNPLTHDGDALRLAVKIGLSLRRDTLDVGVFLRVREMNCGELGREMLRTDPLAATRRAIVRAAAELGSKA